MKKHEIIFAKTVELLKKYFPEILKEYDEGNHIVIGETGVWIECDDNELTIGYGFDHSHYNADYDNLNSSIEYLFELITTGKRVTIFFKGSVQYKNIAEHILTNGQIKHQSSSRTWFYPFWRKTRTKVMNMEPLIDAHEILEEIEELREFVKLNSVKS